MSVPDNIRKTRSYVLEAAVAVALIYFLFGGANWSSAAWVLFAIFAVCIVVMNVHRGVGIESAAKYERWKLGVGLMIVLALLASAIWSGSLMVLALSVVLGVIWFVDLRTYCAVHRESQGSEHKE